MDASASNVIQYLKTLTACYAAARVLVAKATTDRRPMTTHNINIQAPPLRISSTVVKNFVETYQEHVAAYDFSKDQHHNLDMTCKTFLKKLDDFAQQASHAPIHAEAALMQLIRDAHDPDASETTPSRELFAVRFIPDASESCSHTGLVPYRTPTCGPLESARNAAAVARCSINCYNRMRSANGSISQCPARTRLSSHGARPSRRH
jgi:hypothetical protein